MSEESNPGIEVPGEKPPARKVTERDMLTHLHRRYTAVRRGTIADRWVRAEHVKLTLGHARKGRTRIADFIALDTYPGIPYGSALAIHGHEIKVSRSDWLTELRDPTKADAFRPYCNHWWLVVPDHTIVKPDELPDGWGLLTLNGNQLRIKHRSPRQDALPLPTDLTMALAAATARTANRAPHYLDAPTALKDVPDDTHWGYTTHHICAACGHQTPCQYHQPRALAGRKETHP